jgi:DNA-3-methyladenine glycosylase II
MAEAAAVEYLRAADPVMRELIDDLGGVERPRDDIPDDHFGTLIRAIIGQQVSTAAARSMWFRLTSRFDGRTPTPEEILADEPEALRTAAGLSHAKLRYLRSLSEHVRDGSLRLDELPSLPDDEVIAQVTAVTGIGLWSAHVFLMFHLRRPDVVASGDLGIRKAVMQRYGLDAMPTPKQVEAIAEPWRPQRTLACMFLWHSLRMTPVVPV